MLEPPVIPESIIKASLWDEYNLQADNLCFLPLGADTNTAVYRVKAGDTDYFLKLRRADFSEISLAVPRFLHEQGLAAMITPLATNAGQLWGTILDYRMVLYPFIAGRDGYECSLSPKQWHAFGSALRAIHSTHLPPELHLRIPRELFSPRWRTRVQDIQDTVETVEFTDPIAATLAGFMRAYRAEISHLVNYADQLASDLRSQTRPEVLCHGDIHPGNLLLPTSDPANIYIVDWDNTLYAPREHDLAMIGGTYAWRRAGEITRFFRGYRAVETTAQECTDLKAEIDPKAICYFRCERIIIDIAEFCQQILFSANGDTDRAQSYLYLTSAFLPDHEVDLAVQGESFV